MCLSKQKLQGHVLSEMEKLNTTSFSIGHTRFACAWRLAILGFAIWQNLWAIGIALPGPLSDATNEEQVCWPPWPWWSVREVGAGLGQEMEMRVVSGCYSSNFSVHMSLLESLLRCRIWFNRSGGVTWVSLFLTHSQYTPSDASTAGHGPRFE